MKFKFKLLITLLITSLIMLSTMIVFAVDYNESPMLAERVDDGELPPVAERLPENPVVVEPYGDIGTYGGTLKMGFAGRHYAINSMLAGRFTDQGPFTWDKDASQLMPNWAESTEISEDGKTFTLHLREGIKWSDGVPVTVDDLLFTYQEVAGNEDLFPAGLPSWLKGIKFEKIDQYTLNFHFPSPNPLFKYTFQTGSVMGNNILAKHYFKQFHIDYASEQDLEKYIETEGVDNWVEVFELKTQNDNLERPNLHLWKLVKATPDKVVVERNPYYWKVDSEGNQLPYIDKVSMDILSSGDVVTMKSIAGEYDFTIFHLNLADFPMLKKNEAKGGFKVYLWNGARIDAHIKFNQTYEDEPELAKLLKNSQFRKALSAAIDRNEINELVFMGTGKPIQLSPPEGTVLYEEKFAEKYTFDLGKTKEILASINVKDTDGDGWREMPNGEDLLLELLVASDFANHVDIAELIKSYWEDVGVKTKIQSFKFERRSQIEAANTYQASIWKIDSIIYPAYINSSRGAMTAFGEAPGMVAPLWEQWLNTDGDAGIKPSAEYLEAYDIFNKLLAATDSSQRDKLMKQLWNNYYENLWTIGIVQQVPSPIIVNNRLKNVPEVATNAWPIRTPTNAGNYQWYIEE